MVETRKAEAAAKGGDGSGRATLEDLYRQIQAGQAKELRIILKSDVSGSLGAITHALEQLDQDEVRLNVLLEGAGDITDNDIMLAAASNAIVVGFNTKITDTARRAAEAEGRRRPAVRHHLQADRRHRSGPQGPARAGDRGGRRGPRGGPPDHPRRQEHGHRRLVRDRRPDRPRRQRPRVARRQGHRHRPDRVAAPLPRRRPRGPAELRVRHRARRTSTTSRKATSSSASLQTSAGRS